MNGTTKTEKRTKAEMAARRRELRQNPETRAREAAQRLARYAKKKDVLNERRRRKYAEDAEWRERERRRKLESARKRAERMASAATDTPPPSAEERETSMRTYKREWAREWRKTPKGRKWVQREREKTWEKVAAGGPARVAAFMKRMSEEHKAEFVKWYGRRMNWIDRTGTRKFAPPPGAEVYREGMD